VSLGRVASVGAYILDVLARPVDGIPPDDTSEIVEEIRLTVAGAAGAVAVSLARLGADVSAFGAVGTDMTGDLLALTLQRDGVDTAGLVRKPGGTSTSILPVRRSGDRAVWHMRGVGNQLSAEDVVVPDVDVLHVGGPDALGRFAGEPLRTLMADARSRGALVTLDLLGAPGERTLGRLEPILGLVDCFLPSDSQLCALMGLGDPATAAEAVLARGVGTVLVTRGAEGSLVVSADGTCAIPALPAAAVDTTGCGDAYSAGVIAGLLLGHPPAEAAWLGAGAGALVAGGLGSDAGLTTLDALLAFVSEHRSALAR
jgi:sugar/nucleoside kinase (ribokinase family)